MEYGRNLCLLASRRFSEDRLVAADRYAFGARRTEAFRIFRMSGVCCKRDVEIHCALNRRRCIVSSMITRN